LSEPKLWTPIQEKNISFGQGISVSSIQTAAFYASIANDGTLIKPHLIQSIPSKGEYTSAESKVVMKKNTTDTLKKMLEKVVNDGTAQVAQIKGFDVAGKTGTAQIAAEGGGYVEDAYYISFAGFIANSNSNLSCVVGFEKPQTSPAIPVFNKVMKFAIGRYGIVSEK
jgi:cell division protein FtsI (penicillin-binding protein 3)